MIMNVICIIYNGRAEPMATRELRRIVLANEFFVMVATALLMLFTEWVPEVSQRFMFGYLLIGVTSCCVCFNLLFVLYYGFR